jgi:hypothetical protein
LRPAPVTTTDRLLAAFDLLSRRGEGPSAWATPFRDDPIAFLLDTMSDAVTLWGPTGQPLNQNRAALELRLGNGNEAALQSFWARGEAFERRCLSSQAGKRDYMLEIIRQVRAEPSSQRR